MDPETGQQVVLKILTNTWQVVLQWDSNRTKVLLRSDAGKEEDLRGSDGSGRNDDFLLGPDLELLSKSFDRNPDGSFPVVDVDLVSFATFSNMLCCTPRRKLPVTAGSFLSERILLLEATIVADKPKHSSARLSPTESPTGFCFSSIKIDQELKI